MKFSATHEARCCSTLAAAAWASAFSTNFAAVSDEAAVAVAMAAEYTDEIGASSVPRVSYDDASNLRPPGRVETTNVLEEIRMTLSRLIRRGAVAAAAAFLALQPLAAQQNTIRHRAAAPPKIGPTITLTGLITDAT